MKLNSMELNKENIRMNRIIKNEVTSFYLSAEERISSPNMPIGKIVDHHETATVDSTYIKENQISINGTINYQLMYYADDSAEVHGISKEIPYEESVKISGLSEDNTVDVKLSVISSNIKLIDKETYIYKLQIMAYITVEKLEDLELVTSINDEKYMTQIRKIEMLEICGDKKENFRINEQVAIPTGKPDAEKIIWQDVRIKNLATQIENQRITVKGQLYAFVLYKPDGKDTVQQWIETNLNISGVIEDSDLSEDMISYVSATLSNVNLVIDMNEDNENRLINISGILKLNAKLYREKEVQVLDDAYSPGSSLRIERSPKTYEKLLVKNASRTKSTIKLNVGGTKGAILQICNSQATVKIEKIIVSDNGLKAIGKIEACVIYVSSDDEHPLQCVKRETDFEHRIDAENMTPTDKYYVNWRVEQVSSNMISADEIEVKASVALEAIVFNENKEKFISETFEEEVDFDKLDKAPFMKGYVVKQGDTLWNLAKKNYTTVEDIMNVNNLTSDQIKTGDRLLIVKSCQY